MFDQLVVSGAKGMKTNKPWTRKPTIFDSKGVEIKNPPVIGGGSVLHEHLQFVQEFVGHRPRYPRNHSGRFVGSFRLR